MASKKRKVLVTGAAGNIGKYFTLHSCTKYDLRLLEHKREHADQAKLEACGEVFIGDITDLQQMRKACDGIDTVVHLAGDPSPSATWDSLLNANIKGTYNTFVAAKAAGCRRVIYASSIHAISGYPADVQVKPTEPPNPGDLYGVSKCFGEALARYMAHQEGLSSIVLRIGAFQPESAARDPGGVNMMDAWVSERDMLQLIQCAIDVEDLQFFIAHGISDNRFKRMDLTDTKRVLNYKPQDDLTEINPKLAPLHLDDVPAHSQSDARQESGIRNEINAVR